MNKKEIIRTVKFTLFSISAGIIEIGLFTLFTEITNWSYWPSYLIALIASVIWNYFLNKNYTFASNAKVTKSLSLVVLFYLIFTPTSTILGNYLAEDLMWNGYLVTIINMLANFILEYLYDKYIVFKGTIDKKDKKDIH